jgi:hypothetical protein
MPTKNTSQTPIPLYGKVKDIAEQIFGQWTAKYFVYARKRTAYWMCECSCGVRKVVSRAHLTSKRSTSCGRHRERPDIRKHGLCDTTEAKSYYHMVARCTHPQNAGYPEYGQRGIKVCNRWLLGDGEHHGVECFVEDMGNKPTGTSIDRIDNNAHYSCGKCADCRAHQWTRNCRWGTPTQQSNNTRSNAHLEFNGQTKTMSEWGRELNIDNATIWNRLKLGWSTDRALTTPVRFNARWHSSKT